MKFAFFKRDQLTKKKKETLKIYKTEIHSILVNYPVAGNYFPVRERDTKVDWSV